MRYASCMSDEYVDHIDESGKTLAHVLKSHAHVHGLLHPTVIAYVKLGDTWALVRQTPDRQDAGQLVAPVGGHVKAGESEIAALLRETEEEIGVRNLSHRLVGRAQFHRRILGRDENHLFVVYEIEPKDEIVLGTEADAVETFTTEELRQALHATPERFGDAHYFVFEKFYPHMLPTTWQPRWN